MMSISYSLIHQKTLVVFACLFLLASVLTGQNTFYVSNNGNDQWSGLTEVNGNTDGPLKTVNEALVRARAHHHEYKQSSYKIVLRNGVYFMDQLIVITPKDKFELFIEAYPGEKPVISAGRKITEWNKSKVNGTRCWKTKIPEVANGTWYFRQLFVDNQRANRPRIPESGFFEVEDPLLGKSESVSESLANSSRDRFIFGEGDMEDWQNLNDIDIMALHYWVEEILPVKSIDMDKNEVVFDAKSTLAFVRSHPAHSCGNAWYYADNVFEALDSPGEWYLDRLKGVLYYIPFEGQNIEDIDVYAPVKSRIIEIIGNREKEQFAENVHFTGLHFQYSSYQWDAYSGSGNYTNNSGPALILLNYAKNCSFDNCTFKNLGDYAIDINGGSEDISVVHSFFYDMASGAIKVDSRSEDQSFLTVEKMTKRIQISDNEIHYGGQVLFGSPAFVSNYVQSLRFNNNHISNFYYNGIACGFPKRELGCFDNLIQNNLIHDIGKGWLSDMGGIYVKGLQPGMVIRGNVIYNIDAACYGANAIYLDDFAEHMVVENNLLYNAGMNIINMKGNENIISKNVLAYGGESIIRSATVSASDTLIARVSSNIMIVKNKPVFRTRASTPIEKPRFISDNNLIWNTAEGVLQVERPFDYSKPSEWYSIDYWVTTTTNDQNSIIRDPELVSPEDFDFTPKEGSVAYDFGIDFNLFKNAGPRTLTEVRIEVENAIDLQKLKEGHIE